MVHSTEDPATLSPLTKPVPEYPVWFDSTTPCEIVALSASYRVGAAAAGGATTVSAPAKSARTPARTRYLRKFIRSLLRGVVSRREIGAFHRVPTNSHNRQQILDLGTIQSLGNFPNPTYGHPEQRSDVLTPGHRESRDVWLCARRKVGSV